MGNELKPKFGAIRKVYDLDQDGLPVVSLGEMRPGGRYVVGGAGKYKPLPYGDIRAKSADRLKTVVSRGSEMPILELPGQRRTDIKLRPNRASYSDLEETRTI